MSPSPTVTRWGLLGAGQISRTQSLVLPAASGAQMFAVAARDLDREVEQLAATLVALVEPAVLLFMGGVVLLLVLAILLPIIGLNQLAI